MRLPVIIVLCVGVALACDVCRDFGYIDSHDKCKVCNGSGKVYVPKISGCPHCGGDGVHTYRGRYGTICHEWCRFCNSDHTCTNCKGTGTIITRKPCPACRGNPSTPVSGQSIPTAQSHVSPGISCKHCNIYGKVVVDGVAVTCPWCGGDGVITSTEAAAATGAVARAQSNTNSVSGIK